ncbi:hypothetical protein XENOCAPTIV_020499, partial [Xenoophorus captivus]
EKCFCEAAAQEAGTFPWFYGVLMGLSEGFQIFLFVCLQSIPFAGTILGGLLPGEMVLIQGSVDLTCGSSVKPRADVAFHFNPRIKKSCIVCNTLEKERWGREEILYQMPLKVGPGFELIILVLKDKYKVAVNGAHVLEYKHRVDLDQVDTISISGIVNVQTVAVLPPDSCLILFSSPLSGDTLIIR